MRITKPTRMGYFAILLLTLVGINPLMSEETRKSHSGWKIGDAQQLGWNTQKLAQVTEKVEQDEFKKLTSVLIAHKGKLIHEKYYNNGHVDYMNDLRSATKSITSIMVGLAIEHGHLKSVEQKAFSLITADKEYKKMHPLKQAITLQDLLSMSSILGCNDDTPYSMGKRRENVYFLRLG